VRKPLSEFSKTQQKKAKQQSGRGAQCTSCLTSANDARIAQQQLQGRKKSFADPRDVIQRHKLKYGLALSSSLSADNAAAYYDDECGYCGRWWCPLTLQCRHCHKVRYCDEKCMLAHWRAGGHASTCETATNDGDAKQEASVPQLPPDELRCPITLDLFMDPVTAADGVAYERWAIERYFRDRTATLEAWQRELDQRRRTMREGERVQLVMLLASGFSSPMGHGVLATAKLVPNDDLARRAAEWGGVVVESIVSEPHASASPEGQAVFVLLMTKNPQWGKSKCKWVDGKSIVYQDKVQIDPPFQAENCSSLDGDEDTCNMVARWLASSTKKRARRENRFDLAEKNSFVIAGP
jgi:hypothetical protein